MSRLSIEEIEKMFGEFGLARDEDRQPYRDLSVLGSSGELQEQAINVDSATTPIGRNGQT